MAFPLDGGRNERNVGIVVAGGIAPGVNAVIDGIVQRHWAYAGGPQRNNHALRILGYINGFHALDTDFPPTVGLIPDSNYPIHLEALETTEHANKGGSILGTYRLNKLLKVNNRDETLRAIVNRLAGIDILYTIGGDGTMKAAYAVWTTAKETPERRSKPLSVVAIPKTMDNDIYRSHLIFSLRRRV